MRFVAGPIARFKRGAMLFTELEAARAVAIIRFWPGYAPAPLIDLPELAATFGVAELSYKDESGRFGVGIFKGLGAAYAVFRLVGEALKVTGVKVSPETILAGRYNSYLAHLKIASATAGKFGVALAWAASGFAIPCQLHVHGGDSQARLDAMRARRGGLCDARKLCRQRAPSRARRRARR